MNHDQTVAAPGLADECGCRLIRHQWYRFRGNYDGSRSRNPDGCLPHGARIMILLYLPMLALVHFSSGAVLGGMAVLSAKALADMRRQDCAR